MKSTDRVRYNYYSIDFACVSIEFITKSQCMDGKWIAFGHSEGSSYFYSRGYLKYLMVEYRLFPVFIIKIRICVQIVNTGIFAKLKEGQCKKLRGKFINCYLCLQIHSLWS